MSKEAPHHAQKPPVLITPGLLPLDRILIKKKCKSKNKKCSDGMQEKLWIMLKNHSLIKKRCKSKSKKCSDVIFGALQLEPCRSIVPGKQSSQASAALHQADAAAAAAAAISISSSSSSSSSSNGNLQLDQNVGATCGNLDQGKVCQDN